MNAGSAERRDGMASSKITPRHLELLAIVYVRQSHYLQSVNHPESTRVQYSLTDHAVPRCPAPLRATRPGSRPTWGSRPPNPRPAPAHHRTEQAAPR